MNKTLLENEVYKIFETLGIDTPPYKFVKLGDSPLLTKGKNYVAKIVDAKILHKTDQGGIVFNVSSEKATDVCKEFAKKFPVAQGVLFVEQIEYPKNAEVMLGGYIDPFFGPLVTIGFGGTYTEYLSEVMKKGKAKAIFSADTPKERLTAILSQLPVVKIITGEVRGCKKLVELKEIVSKVEIFQKIMNGKFKVPLSPPSPSGGEGEVEEIEINPMVPFGGKLVALDGIIRTTDNVTKATQKPIKKISSLLDPHSACIVGASGKNKANPANIILFNLLKAGINKDQLYLLHPKESEIDGIPCIKNLGELSKKRGGKPVDLLVVGVPAKSAVEVINEALEFGSAEAIQIISAGFGETSGGKELEKEMEENLHKLDNDPKKRPVVNGPNTLGNIYKDVETLFTAKELSSWTGVGKRNTALICQSGAFLVTAISNLAGIINPKASISVGNQMDLTLGDFYEYFLNDKDVNTLGLYIEGLKNRDGENLLKLIEKAKEAGKRTVVYKAGRTKEGIDAAKGHTASMAGDYSIFEALFTQSGAMVAETPFECLNLLMLSSFTKPFKSVKNFGIAALSNAGFEKCAIADHLMTDTNGKFRLAEYSEATKKRIAEIYASKNASSIMDIHDILDLTPMMDDKGFDEMIRTTLADPNVHFGIYAFVPETVALKLDDKENGIIARLIRIYKETDKPFCVSIESGWKYDEYARKLLESGIPCFRKADQAARFVNKFLKAIL